MKKFFIPLIAAMLVLQPLFVMADIGGAKTYLKAQTQDAWTTQALIAAGESGVPVNHLTNVSGNLATDYAKTILALAAAGKNPANFSSVDYVAKLKTYCSGGQMGDASLLNDDAWSILALASVGEINGAEAIGAKNFLAAHQNSDGGWSYAAGGASDTNDTAAAIMALIEAGVNPGDQSIAKAVDYLKSAQNGDGGFGYSAGAVSDSGSDSWVISAIYKLGQNPDNWKKNNISPKEHLQTLQDADGGFWWVKPKEGAFNNKAMTSFAVIALAGKSFPVGYYQNSETGKYHIRIEGSADTICDAYADGETALDVIKNAVAECNYTYNIQDTAYGPYLNKINGEEAAGMSGWMYFVNYESPPVGAADYQLKKGDEVLWYYGEWGWQPLKLSVSDKNPEANQSITASAQYYNNGSWKPLAGAKIKGGGKEYAADNSGQAEMKLQAGIYGLYAEKTGYVRSNGIEMKSGGGAIKNISLAVEVEQGEKGKVAGEAIIFNVKESKLDYAKLKPGNSSEQKITVSNNGTVDLKISASVSGDQLFKDNLKLDSEKWTEYETDLNTDKTKEIVSALAIPADYIGSGVKTGELVLWGQAR